MDVTSGDTARDRSMYCDVMRCDPMRTCGGGGGGGKGGGGGGGAAYFAGREQGHPDMSSLQRSDIIGTVAAHKCCCPAGSQHLEDKLLLLW